MKIVEFRIPLPLGVEHYQIGQLFTVAEGSKNECGGGQGVTVSVNRPFANEPIFKNYSSGQYTEKTYHFEKKVSPFWRRLFPKSWSSSVLPVAALPGDLFDAGALHMDELAWNAYPYCKTVLSNKSFFGDKFEIQIISLHMPDNGSSENVFELNKNDLNKREVVWLDICSDKHVTEPDKQALSLRNLQQTASSSCKKHPLQVPTELNWYKKTPNYPGPMMCAYKLIRIRFEQFGMQNLVERKIAQTYPRLFMKFHRQLLVWFPRWCCLTMAKIREIEEQAKREMDKLIATDAVRGMTDEEEKSTQDKLDRTDGTDSTVAAKN